MIRDDRYCVTSLPIESHTHVVLHLSIDHSKNHNDHERNKSQACEVLLVDPF
jgi:hypothetical protein